MKQDHPPVQTRFLLDVGPTVAELTREGFALARELFLHRCPSRHFHFSRLRVAPGTTELRGDLQLTDITITDLQTITGTVSGVDAEGHDAPLDGASLSAESSNTAICSASFTGTTLTISADGSDLGLAQVALTATLADGSVVSDIVNVTVTASAAAGIKVAFGPPTP